MSWDAGSAVSPLCTGPGAAARRSCPITARTSGARAGRCGPARYRVYGPASGTSPISCTSAFPAVMSLTARLERFIIPGTLRRIPVRLAARPGPGPEVTGRQRESYPEQGFLVAGKVLDDAELQDWRTAVDQAVDGRGRQRFLSRRARRIRRPGDRKRNRNTTIRSSRSAIISGRPTRRSGVYCCSPLSENTSQIWPESTESGSGMTRP
jgi:hypothetical protein